MRKRSRFFQATLHQDKFSFLGRRCERALLTERYGFMEIPGIPNRLFLPMATVERMFVDAGVNVDE